MVKDVLVSRSLGQTFLDSEVAIVSGEVRRFDDAVRILRNLIQVGVEQLFSQLVRPRLRQLVSEVYKDVSYALNEEAYASVENADPVRKKFVKGWSQLLDVYKANLSHSNYRAFFTLAVDVIIRPWEKAILNMKFTELGAIRFDHDIRSVMTYLSSQTAFGDAREKFQRLQHISTLLNLDMDENVDDFYSSSGVPWKVSLSEARSIVTLRM